VVNAADMLIEVKETYDVSSEDMCFLYEHKGKPINKANMSAWLSGKWLPPFGVIEGTPQLHEEISWLASHLKANPNLHKFTYAHFKAAINKILFDTIETQ